MTTLVQYASKLCGLKPFNDMTLYVVEEDHVSKVIYFSFSLPPELLV